jgi:hypothetical protein
MSHDMNRALQGAVKVLLRQFQLRVEKCERSGEHTVDLTLRFEPRHERHNRMQEAA